MKTFKQYLKEAPPAWTESLSTMLFDLPRAGYKDVKIPLSPAIFKRIWPDSIRSKVFHLTDFSGIEKLKKMQGKKKSISAFYNIAVDRIDYGIQTEGGYVVEMDADVLVAAPDDIGSQPDKTGRRWLTWSTILNMGGNKIKKMEKDLKELLMGLIMKYADDPGKSGMPNVNKSWIALGKEYGSRSREDNKIKSQIIKDYLDGMEKIMKKYSAKLKSVLLDYVKIRASKPEPDSGDVPEWDELVVNNFKIQKIHVNPEFSPDFEDDDDIDGFPFEMWNDDQKLSDHIAKIVKKGK